MNDVNELKNRIKLTLRDSKTARWTALLILSFTMFAGYLFTEIMSSLKPMLERGYGWDSSDWGTFTSSYGWFNVFFVMLIIVGVLLDKLGIRFSTLASVMIMIAGGTLKFLAFRLDIPPEATLFGEKMQVMIASFGFALFGVGVEYAGITVSKSVVKWFNGKEMALAMGMQVAIARLGSAVPLLLGPIMASNLSVPTTILVAVALLVLGLIAFFFYNMKDKKLDKQLAEQMEEKEGEEEEGFKISDMKATIGNKGFWLIAFLCVLFYGAVFPFYKYGADLMVNKFGFSEEWAGLPPFLVPFGTMLLTPIFGSIYDKRGKGATIMIIGAVMLVVVHAVFYAPMLNHVAFAIANVILLGIAFSLVPSAMWPSVPKIIPEKQLGSAYALIFWVQNLGLWGIPLLVGKLLNNTNPGINEKITAIGDGLKEQGLSAKEVGEKIVELREAGEYPVYDYQQTWLVFVGLTILALIVALLLKREDKIKGYGLELPNIKKEEE